MQLKSAQTMQPYIKDNILFIPITRGLPFQLTFDSPDLDLTQYDTIRAEFKPSRDLKSPPLLRADLEEGIVVTPPVHDGDDTIPSTLTLAIPSAHTAGIRPPKLYMDLKGRVADGEPVLLLQAECDILASVTDI